MGVALDALPEWSGRGADGARIQGRVARIRLALDDGKGSRGEWNSEVVFANVRRNLFGFQEGQQFFDCHFYNGREELVMDLRGGAPLST